MSARIDRWLSSLDPIRTSRIPVSVRKAQSITESFRSTEGEPHVVRCAKAFSHTIERAELFIEPDMLLVGNGATRPFGVELTPLWATWPEDELDALERDGYILDDDVRETMPELNEYWRGRSVTSLMTRTYDDERLWPYAQMGVVLPAFKSKEEGWGAGGLLGGGYGFQHEISQFLGTPDYGKVLDHGLQALVDDIDEHRAAVRLGRYRDFERAEHYEAAAVAWRGVQRLVQRFADVARADAATHEPARAAELAAIADSCDHLVTGRPRTLREAMQLYWFLYVCMLPSGTLGMGRVDQLFHPWYEEDRARGMPDEEAVELFANLRMRSMGITVQGGTAHRSKWAGGSKWHNAVVGGVHADGSDATNELSYLVLEAAKRCPTPHHTLTQRVHEDSPSAFLQAGLDLVATGLGMPAFVGDPSNIEFLRREGIEEGLARDYNMAGSLSVTLSGRSRLVASPMFVVPRVLSIALHGGVDPTTGTSFGEPTPSLADCSSFEEFQRGFERQLASYLALQGEFNNVTIRSIADRYPRPLESALMEDGLESGEDVFRRTLPYENANFVNVIGLVNAADALYAIRQLVFEERTVDAERLVAAIDRDWTGEGDEELRQRILELPKYGNDDDEVDALLADLYATCARIIRELPSVAGGSCKPSALTIGTSPWPGGRVTGASADGRRAEDPLAEESLTPMRGREQGSVWDVVRSAAKVDQDEYQSTELDLRIEASAFDDPATAERLEALIRWYVADGGKHLQFNVADTARLRAALETPEDEPDLVVRLGGTSAYFQQLSRSLREEILNRHYFDEVAPAPA